MNTQKRIANQLAKVEKILNVSQDTMNEIEMNESEEIETFDVEVIDDNENLPSVVTESTFELNELKKSFDIAKRSLQQLINYGQGLMSQTVTLEIQDLKASDIAAIAQLSATVSSQLKMMLEMFKDITEIELNIKELKEKSNPALKNLPPGSTVTQNNKTIVFQGTTSDIIKSIKEDM